MTQKIAVIRGDGIGPEIMDATLHVLEGLDLGLEYDFVDAGLSAYEKTGELLPAATLEAITRHRVALKSPLTTPVGEGFSSINVELRKRFDLYANVRPAISFPNTDIPGDVGFKFRTPRLNIGLGLVCKPAPGMPMPKTAMHEDYFLSSREHQVRSTREIAPMKSETIPEPVRQTAYGEFRFGVSATDAGHHRGPTVGRNYIHVRQPGRRS